MLENDIFWYQFTQYNTAIFPLQIILYIIALGLSVALFIKPGKLLSNLLKTFLFAVFLFVGIVFFIINGSSILAKIFGVVFIIIGIYFLIDIFLGHIYFSIAKQRLIKYSTVFWMIIVFVVYPGTGLLLGHSYPEMCFPIATPCPLTIFTIALLVASIPRINKIQFILILPWAILAIPKMLGMYGCYEDGFLFISGLYGIYFLIKNWKSIPFLTVYRFKPVAKRPVHS